MFVPWLLKYSSFFITGIVSLIVGYVLHRLTASRSDLTSYSSHVQWVSLAPAQKGQPPIGPIGTFGALREFFLRCLVPIPRKRLFGPHCEPRRTSRRC